MEAKAMSNVRDDLPPELLDLEDYIADGLIDLFEAFELLAKEEAGRTVANDNNTLGPPETFQPAS